MVRLAKHSDFLAVAHLLRLFHTDPVSPAWFNTMPSRDAEKEVLVILNQSHSFIAYEEDVPVGILLSQEGRVPFLEAHTIEEIAWFVHPDYRHTRIGFELLKAWEAHVDDLKKHNLIVGGLIHTMKASLVDLEKHGYTLADLSYMR